MSNSKLGLWLFAFYGLVYGLFVIVSAFAPNSMEMVAVAGLNVAVVWGFALILLALVLSLVYGTMCSDEGEAVEESKDT